MSDDFLETIWVQYAVETEEHIESIESLLVKADAEELNAEEISGLFRAFHSLKGLSRVMELTALEAIAHRAEDLLGLVREGQTSLDKTTVDVLLRGLDAIKVLRDLAVSQRSDGDKPEELLKELERAYRKVTSGGDEPAAEAPVAAAAAPAAAPDTGQAATAAAPAAASAPAAAPAPAGKPSETSDKESVFLRLVKHGLPVLEQLATSIASKQEPSQILSVANDIRGPLGWMLKASAKQGYAGLNTRIEDILAALPTTEEVSAKDGEHVVDVIVAFLSDLRTLSETSGSDLGGESLAQVLARTLKENLNHLLIQITANLDLLQSGEGSIDEVLADQISQEFSRVQGYLSSLYPSMHCEVPLLLMDAYARAARSQMGIYDEVIAVTRDGVQFIQGLTASTKKDPLKQDGMQSKQDQLIQRMRDYLWSHDSAGAAPVDAIKAFVASMNIPHELAELLSPDNMRELMELIQDGANAFVIMAHLESSEKVATDFLSWVHGDGRVITNRTVFVDTASWYEMLYISKAERGTIQSELEAIDAGHGLIRLMGQLGKDYKPQPIAPLTATPESTAVVQAAAVSAKAQASAAKAPASSPAASAAAPAAAPAAPAAVPASAAPAAADAPTAAVAPRAAAPKPAAAAAPAAPSSNVIRVPGEMLDQFMNQIGEMVLVRGQLAHIISDHRVRDLAIQLRRDSDAVSSGEGSSTADFLKLVELVEDQSRRLQETDALIQGALSRLQDSVMGLRVVPVELVFKRFPRMVRDLAQAQGKQIRLELLGQEVKIDKAMVESLADPLLHMVRNSADHGVEKPEERRAAGKPEEAVIRIQAEQQGSRIMIRVTDDGKGIDAERVRAKAVERGLIKEDESHQLSKEDILKFIFRAGFSTAEVVTETSGRGVGMDVVRTNVMRLGGSIHLDSEVGRGTIFTMQMPLSAAVQEVLLVNTANQTLAIPGRYVAELVEVDESQYQTVKGRSAILLRGTFLPVVRLEDLLGFPAVNHDSHRYIVVLSDGQRTLGVSVSEFVGRQELFTKDIHPRLSALPGVGGASILGDGRVVLILDGAAIYRLAENAPAPGMATEVTSDA
ncbi:MAG: Chemotaxis sensor histidine kinase CheA [Pseudomonadota bacterium]|jgi:chemotaxis protein histidine kinase CheA